MSVDSVTDLPDLADHPPHPEASPVTHSPAPERQHDPPQTLTRELRIPSAPRCTGTVRWFSGEKGYGFITPDAGGEDVFVRFSAIERDGFRSLDAGQQVSYLPSWDERGPRAAAVQIFDVAASA